MEKSRPPLRSAAGTGKNGGDIQATTKVADFRSFKSSPPNLLACFNRRDAAMMVARRASTIEPSTLA